MPRNESQDAQPPTAFQLSNYDRTFRDEAHERLARLRDFGPALRDPSPALVNISHHAAIRGALGDPTTSMDPARCPDNPYAVAREQAYAAAFEAMGMLKGINSLDDEEHRRVRTTLIQPFQARAAAFRPQVETVVRDAVAGLRGRETFDVLGDFAQAIPMRVVANVMGVAGGDLDNFRDWSRDYLLSSKPRLTDEEQTAMILATAKLWELFSNMLRERRVSPADDLVSDLAKAQAEGAEISDAEIVSNLQGLLAAGNPTTADLIVNGIWLLLAHPAELARLRADPRLIVSTVEEVLRFEPPAMVGVRFNMRDGEVAGCPVRKGDLLALQLAAANRDPEIFDDPNRFDIGRKPNRHLTFGGGAHICPGAPLARLQAQTAISALVAAFPNLRAVETGPPRWRGSFGFRGLERLDVSVA